MPSYTPEQQRYIDEQRLWIQRNNISVGSRVKVIRAASDRELGWMNSWSDFMNQFVNRILRVISNNNSTGGIALESGHSYPFFVLERVHTITVDNNDPININPREYDMLKEFFYDRRR